MSSDLIKSALMGGSSEAMRELAQKREKDSAFNPASPDGVATAAQPARRRIPLSVPRRKLEAAPIPGFVLYWFKVSNIQIALEAGYDFVDSREVTLNQSNQSNSSDESGNISMGSRVEAIGDRIGDRGVPDNLVLMKIREEWWREDRVLLDNENATIIRAIFGGEIIAADRGMGDHSQSYVRTSIAHGKGSLFNRGLKKQT